MEETLRRVHTNINNTTKELSPEELVDKYNEPIWRFCRSLTYSKEDAEDLMQETFLKAFEQMIKINSSDNPKSFLFSTALFLWKSKKRKYARRARIVPIQPLDDEAVSVADNGIEDDIMAKEDVKAVRTIVDGLPEKFKVPIILFYTMEMSQADIGATLKLPVGTVKSRLFKGRQIIEKGLIEVGYEK